MSRSFGSAMLVIAALGSALGFYTLTLKVSAERAAVDSLRAGMVADARDIRMLRSELLTRARLPELQRWNDTVLLLNAPTERQFVHDPVQLAGFAVTHSVPSVTLAVATTTAPTAPSQAASVAGNAPEPQTAVAAVQAPSARPAPMVRPLASGLRQIAYVVPAAGAARAAPAVPHTLRAPAPGLDADAVASIEKLTNATAPAKVPTP